MLQRPFDSCGSRFARILGRLVESFSEPSVIDHEWLVPLIEHLVEFSHQGHRHGHRLHDPPRQPGSSELSSRRARQPRDEVSKRTRPAHTGASTDGRSPPRRHGPRPSSRPRRRECSDTCEWRRAGTVNTLSSPPTRGARSSRQAPSRCLLVHRSRKRDRTLR